ncbi:putative serine dehydratase domain-containing protein [Podospora aff. communis PSN243]|uniref:Serine dehydratase domain-containing protein n=1 Tax=Podospora aff. communis PSN243 TaxID=3040156 RepID=A0AAV9G934_9PEZI|nr:putative serine dehydratase domain-containing protein [Podospora aff. communis PSN243]
MQVGTGSVGLEDQAVRVVAEVCSVYPERNEALINAGVLALSKETSGFPGYGTIIGHPGWYVRDVSQEHGIVSVQDNSQERVEESFKVGDKLLMYISHSCITAAAYPYYCVVDQNDVVTEIWHPWKRW